MASSNLYVYGTNATKDPTLFSENVFVGNSDVTVTDTNSGLMWSKQDSGRAMNWQDALASAQEANTSNYLDHDDWRVPNIKELQVLLDYSRSPDTTNSPALDPVFSTSEITNEAGQVDYPFVWSSTSHANWTDSAGSAGAYVSFGRAMGYFDNVWTDVHGAGAQRSDPKTGNPYDYPEGHDPQGDAQRIDNYVRLVRNAE